MRRLHAILRDTSREESPSYDDQRLLSRMRANDQSAFEAIFRAYYALLCSVANQYLHSRDEAQDAAQHVFFTLWRNRATFQISGSLKEYLCASVRNRALNILAHDRVVRLHREITLQDPTHSTSREDAHARLETDERRARIAQALAELPPRQRAVCTLRWIDGLSYTEIAQRLGIAEKTIANQLTRALQGIRAAISNDF